MVNQSNDICINVKSSKKFHWRRRISMFITYHAHALWCCSGIETRLRISNISRPKTNKFTILCNDRVFNRGILFLYWYHCFRSSNSIEQTIGPIQRIHADHNEFFFQHIRHGIENINGSYMINCHNSVIFMRKKVCLELRSRKWNRFFFPPKLMDDDIEKKLFSWIFCQNHDW